MAPRAVSITEAVVRFVARDCDEVVLEGCATVATAPFTWPMTIDELIARTLCGLNRPLTSKRKATAVKNLRMGPLSRSSFDESPTVLCVEVEILPYVYWRRKQFLRGV
jgi:hypothetical protein